MLRIMYYVLVSHSDAKRFPVSGIVKAKDSRGACLDLEWNKVEQKSSSRFNSLEKTTKIMYWVRMQ